jgi:hypothetical protein
VTAPVDDAARLRLAAVAGWDVPLIRGAVATLAAVAARLPTWRTRLGAVARSLEDPRSWSGPAARSAAAAAFEVSVVAAAVNEALADSLAAFERLAGKAAAAQELAGEALRSAGPALDPELQAHQRLTSVIGALAPGAVSPSPDPATELAAEALAHADAAAAAAEAAEPPSRLVHLGAGGRPTFQDLATAVVFVGPVAPPVVPARSSPEEVASWWATLSTGAQLAAVRGASAAVGALDGLPAWARNQANRLVLARALGDPRTPPAAAAVARVVSSRIAAEEEAGRQVQLHLLDLAGDRVVLAFGDLDTADAVALLVPGIANTPGDDLGRLSGDAADVGDAARAAVPGLTVATAVWLGYRPPSTLPGIATRAAATRGGAALASALEGLAAARTGAAAPPVRTTVLAHSYGTVVVDEAADAPGRLPADAVVLLGSPGMEDDAAGLEAPEVFDAAGGDDPIAWLDWFGRSPGAARFGATELPVDPAMGHSDYYAPDRPTLSAIGEVVAGVRAAP